MTMVPAAAHHHHHHHQTLSSRQEQEQHHLYGGGYGGCCADYYNNAAPDDEESFGSLMSQVEEGGGGGGGYDHQYNNYCNANNSTITDHHHQLAANYVLGGSNSDLILVNDPMAEDESRTNSLNTEAAEFAEAAEAGSTSKAHGADEDERDDQRWLQLGIGGNTATSADAQSTERRNLPQLLGSSSASGLIELDLLSENMTSSRQLQNLQQARSPMLPMFHVPDHHHHQQQIRVPHFATNLTSTTSSNLYFQHPGIGMGMGMNSSLSSSFPQQQQHHQEVNPYWGFRPLIPAYNNNNNIIIGNNSASTSSSSSSFIQLGPSSSSSSSYFARPFQFSHYHHQYHGGAGAAGPSLDFRVVDPPRRPQSGIWFMLQASRNQETEPFLPQIPKSYLRIKDGRMTVRLIKKYLVNKLRLDSESEVEITCRGQQLVPFLTLQHVRDNIWSLRDAAAAADHLALLPLPDSTDDHVMVLHYARTSSSSTTA